MLLLLNPVTVWGTQQVPARPYVFADETGSCFIKSYPEDKRVYHRDGQRFEEKIRGAETIVYGVGKEKDRVFAEYKWFSSIIDVNCSYRVLVRFVRPSCMENSDETALEFYSFDQTNSEHDYSFSMNADLDKDESDDVIASYSQKQLCALLKKSKNSKSRFKLLSGRWHAFYNNYYIFSNADIHSSFNGDTLIFDAKTGEHLPYLRWCGDTVSDVHGYCDETKLVPDE